ncbi:purine nucleoside phosphorylase [Elysia marginata]|uniref:Purine nucleoside phosphorylase n=1 Tax=Elysia marginata TaxID=1093978 RepID=A0AAV4IC33_9GAST|nr:purine nucleoside phosphorylase [Elysia marginata]
MSSSKSRPDNVERRGITFDDGSSSKSRKIGGAFSSVTYEDVQKIAKHILAIVKCRPKIGVICGSGLGQLAELVEDSETIPYNEIPDFPVSTVPGHAGKLVFGTLKGKSVVLMQGRTHSYEGYSPQQTTLPVRTMKLMGVETLFVTNAAGGINRNFKVGDMMIIKDHMNLAGFSGMNPLVGPNDERFGPRFPPMSRAYDLDIRKLAHKVVKEMNYTDFVHEGVYSMMVGPNFETVTECKFLHTIGVDATGMSTVPEVLVAKHCGMRVFGMSLITNVVIMEFDSEATANHEEVLETGRQRSKYMQKLIATIIEKLDS